MRNTTLRKTLESLASVTNEALNAGIEPLALAISLRNMADQLDRLAVQMEQTEQKEEENDEQQNV